MSTLPSIQNVIDERLGQEGLGLVKPARFSQLIGRMLATGVLWRDYSAPEKQYYDDAVQCEELLREWFSAMGFVLTHDADAQLFRLYPPGEGDTEDDGVKRLKARLSRDFVACCIALRFLYTEGLTGKREMVNSQVVISLEELSQALVSLLGHVLPTAAADRVALLRDLRKHRVIRFNDEDGAGSMETLLSILRPVMSFVSDEALEDSLRVAERGIAIRHGKDVSGLHSDETQSEQTSQTVAESK